MIRFIRVTTEGPFPGETKFRTKHNRAMKAGHQRLGDYWITVVRGRHFTADAHFRYGFAPRSFKYQARKKKKMGHNIDLVWSGDSERETTHSRVVPTSKRALMKIPMGSMNYRGGKGGIDMRDELLRTKATDDQEMAAAFHGAYTLELQRQRGGSTTLLGAA